MSNFPCKELRNLIHVNRWPITRTIRQQSVVEHSFYVAVYAKYFAEVADLPTEVIDYIMHVAIFHDIKEIATSDIISPIKRELGRDKVKEIENDQFDKITKGYEVHDVNPDDKTVYSIIKLADMVEGVIFLKEEMLSGNYEATSNFIKIFTETQNYCGQNFDRNMMIALDDLVHDQDREMRIVS